MAKMELRKPISLLFDEKTKIESQVTGLVNELNMRQEKLQKLRSEQFGYREAKEHLPNNNSSKPARKVFDDNIAACQRGIDEVLKEMDKLEKDRSVVSSKLKSIEKSIKDLQNA